LSNQESESIRVNQVLTGSVERVFNAWTDPAVVQRWLAPKAEIDARAGGRFRLEVVKPEGAHVVTGTYLEFVRNERLVMTWVYHGPMAAAGEMEALLTVELRKQRVKYRTHAPPRKAHQSGVPRHNCKRLMDDGPG
jgi:uncharacterized protein YndB with AHSA1/START domain